MRDPAAQVFARGFVLSSADGAALQRLPSMSPYLANLSAWQRSRFGPCSLWADPRLNCALREDGRLAVAVLGLCIDPAQGLAENAAIAREALVVAAIRDFIAQTDFNAGQLLDYDLHDMFYWEHRNSKWQNLLCAEAEMATDVFIPYNNRRLLCALLSVPPQARAEARVHREIWRQLMPAFDEVELA